MYVFEIQSPVAQAAPNWIRSHDDLRPDPPPLPLKSLILQVCEVILPLPQCWGSNPELLCVRQVLYWLRDKAASSASCLNVHSSTVTTVSPDHRRFIPTGAWESCQSWRGPTGQCLWVGCTDLYFALLTPLACVTSPASLPKPAEMTLQRIRFILRSVKWKPREVLCSGQLGQDLNLGVVLQRDRGWFPQADPRTQP